MIYFKDSEELVYCFCESDLTHDENVKAKIKELQEKIDINNAGYIEELKSTIRIDESLVRISKIEADALTVDVNPQFELMEHEWVKSELDKVQIELMYHWTDDKRAVDTIESWKKYARELRDYTTTDGDNAIVLSHSRPTPPIVK